MPIRTQQTVRDVQQRFRPSDPRTAAFAVGERPPEYKQAPPDARTFLRDRFETATLTQDLHYFQAIANGEQAPEVNQQVCMVLNFYRMTQTHIRPICERFMLGQASGAPYYALHAAPHATSSDEFNNLVIKRRDPITGIYTEVCVPVVHARLNLHAPGLREIASMQIRGVAYSVSWGDAAAVGVFGGCYCVWQGPHAIAQIYAGEGWVSLNQDIPRGLLKIKGAKKLETLADGRTRYEDPRCIGTETLGYLDFQREVPQMVSESGRAHQFMDAIIGGLFTMMVVETRKQDQIAEYGSLPGYQE